MTYHLRRERGEGYRAFFGRWDVAMRKVAEHGVALPEKYIGFLLINALNLQDADIKALVSFTQGSILQKDVRAWMRKYETKLQVSQVGIDKKDKSNRVLLTEGYDDLAEDAMELHMMENALRDLRGEEDGSTMEANDDDDQIHALEEHEAAEILATLVQKKRTFLQNAKTKKSVELGRGYRGGSAPSSSSTTTANQAGLRPGRFKASGKIDMTIEELKKVTKCGICKKPGHWWKECPQRDKEKEAHVLEVPLTQNLESEEALFCGLVETDRLPPEEHLSSCNRLSRDFSEPADPSVDGHYFSTVGEAPKPAQSVYKVRDHEVLFEEHESVSGEDPINIERPPTLRDTPVHEDECATIDTGCQRMAVGQDTLSRMAKRLPDGLSVNLVRQVHRFRSVHGRSSTQHVANLPSSLGPKGSLLKPAVFESGESRAAPFLLSLPFLLFCRTVLTLDPEVGLSAHFKRLGFTTPCHLGPSGALRVPLCNFTPQKIARIQKAMHAFQAETAEFEVLKVQDTSSRTSHGGTSRKEEPGAAERRGLSALETSDAATPLSSQAGDRARHEPSEDAGCDHDRTEPYPADKFEEQSTILEPRVGGEAAAAAILAGAPCQDRPDEPTAPSGDWRPAELQARRSVSVDGQSEAGRQSGTPVLDMSSQSTSPVRDLHVVQESAPLGPGAKGGCSQAGISGEEHDRFGEAGLPGAVRAPAHYSDGEQRLQASGEVRPVRVCDHRDDEATSPGQAEGEAGGAPELQGAGGPGGLPAVQGLASADADEPAGVRRLQEQQGAIGSAAGSVEDHCLGETGPALQPDGRLLRQATVALRQAEQMWVEIMNLLRSSESDDLSRREALRQKFDARGTTDPLRSKKFLKFAGRLLGNRVKPRHVAELFNPNRFQPRVSDQGLRSGIAFDLELGDDMLKASTRKYIREYFEFQKPGLVVISPPCVMYSALQALNVRHLSTPERLRIHLRRVAEAKVLLNFAIEMCWVVYGYGGTFVLEHPWTSRAWRSPSILKLFNQQGVRLAYNDQCEFGLRSSDGNLHKKPTGWLTNNKVVHKELSRVCSGRHVHEHIMGGNSMGSKSRQAQHYPPQLVDAILRSYQQSLKESERPHKVEKFPVMQHIKQALNIDMAYMEHQALDELMAKDVLSTCEILAAEDDPDIEEGEQPDMEEGEQAETEEGDASYKVLPREKPFSVAQLVRRAHNGLGHPTTDTLVRILTAARASPEAIAAARELKCSICHQHQKIRPSRAAAPPRNLHVNSIVGVDAMWIQGLTPGGPRRMALNIVDWASRFQMVIPLASHTPEAARQAFCQWVRFFGPPERVYNDLGGEFSGVFKTAMEEEAIFVDPGSLEMPEQRGITERAGKTYKAILAKTLEQVSCEDWDTWEVVVSQVCMTVNRLTNRAGHSPIQRVLGYQPRLPGGLLTGGAHDHGVAHRYHIGDKQVQWALKVRYAASVAFHQADCDQALRNALHHGPRRHVNFEPGQEVYFWRKGAERARKDNSSFWRGPARVVLTNPPTSIWVAFQGYLIKAAPEHLRLASTEEHLTLSGWIDDIAATREALAKVLWRSYIELKEIPDIEEDAELGGDDAVSPPRPRFPLRSKTPVNQVTFREQSVSDLPAPPSPPDDLYLPDITEDERAGPAPEPSEPAPMDADPSTTEARPAGVIRAGADDLHEEERPAKRHRQEFLEAYLTNVEGLTKQRKRKETIFNQLSSRDKVKFEKAIAKELKQNLLSGAYELISLKESEEIRRQKPDKIMKSRFLFTEKPLEPDDVESARKEGLLLDDADGICKAKARHVMQGFSEHGAEYLPSTTPQVAKDSVLLTLQVLCSMGWTIGNLDFTQAFHSGGPIARELYAEQPKEGLPDADSRQLLRLKKTCYGLTDGPWAWYQHLRTELLAKGYVLSTTDPCLYILREGDELHGLISLATDDMIHGGSDKHWVRMEELRQKYKMGKYTTGGGRFAGKEIETLPDGRFLVHMKPYIENKLNPVPLSRDRKRRRYSYCTPAEISALRGAIGELSWICKESRPDVAGRVGLLQQCMPEPMIFHIIEANAIIQELKRTSAVGITINKIPIERLRVGVITDASWGNSSAGPAEANDKDTWEETSTSWIRHHVQSRRTLFHPGSAPRGPDLHEIDQTRSTKATWGSLQDSWNHPDAIRVHGSTPWTGMTTFMKQAYQQEMQKPICERFLQFGRTGSQGGYLLFFYDAEMEHSREPRPITIAAWKSYRLKRCTVNTLSAETQSMLQGVGQVHWHRAMLYELFYNLLTLNGWENEISELPFVAITDSKSLYDTVTKCRNSSSHVDDKRTAIDLSILKRDLVATQGQVRWVEGRNMLSDPLTKKMGSSFLRNVMTRGLWSLHEHGHQAISELHTLLSTKVGGDVSLSP